MIVHLYVVLPSQKGKNVGLGIGFNRGAYCSAIESIQQQLNAPPRVAE